ncbi:MAG: LL-diaminopimelate aminotransferase [Coriobacteriales bacterium]|jgi:LL-diaminopimelate aminotransferase
MRVNENFGRIEQSYLFSTVARKVSAYKQANPDKRVIRLGIGDVTEPLAPAIIDAMHAAVDEMADKKTFRGYCDDAEGYEFLRAAVAERYESLGAEVGVDEVFISDGAKSDLGNFLDLTASDAVALIPDPVYPAYVDTNLMNGHQVRYVHSTAESGYIAKPDDSIDADLVYICSPNNPTGSVYGADDLAAWVQYALDHQALIIFDSAYETFIRTPGLPHTIYEIDGAERCAVEISSFSKMAGFTGVRCGFTVVPKTLTVAGSADLNQMWRRRQNTKFNGVPYIVQRAAQAALSPLGRTQTRAQVDYYLGNAAVISQGLDEMGIFYTGAKNSPYVWMHCPDNMGSWDFFDRLLEEAQVVGTPGVGFGPAGEGCLRLSAFGQRPDIEEAIARMKAMLA